MLSELHEQSHHLPELHGVALAWIVGIHHLDPSDFCFHFPGPALMAYDEFMELLDLIYPVSTLFAKLDRRGICCIGIEEANFG